MADSPPRRCLAAIGGALLALALCLPLASPALADGTPVRVVLDYLSKVSNWGPTDAGGVLDLVRAEGEARLTVRGLPKTPGQHFVLWLAHEGTNDVFRLGELQLQPDGTATLDLYLPDPIPNRAWNLALVTVESTASPDRPGPHRSVAGRFPQRTFPGNMPTALPNTGLGGAASDGRSVALSTSLLLGIIGGTGFAVHKRYRQRR